MDSIKTQLINMGFSESKIECAIKSCPEAQTLEQVMEWLIAHDDELEGNQPSTANKNPSPIEKTDQPAAAATSSDEAGSQQKQLQDDPNESAANLAAKKKLTVDEAKKLIAERQTQRAEEERLKQIEDEKRRRVDGQKLTEARLELQDQERIRLAQQIRREKQEQEAYKKSLLEQIARDREALKLRNPTTTATTTTTSAGTTASSNSATSSSPSATRSRAPSTECRLALRLPDGSNIMHKFSPQEQLAAVRLFVQMEKNTTLDMDFVAPPNKKFTSSQMDETLEALGLCPASRLEVKLRHEQWSDLD